MGPNDAVRVESIDFGHLVIDFDDQVLRPRPWTAMQSRWAAELLAGVPTGRVLELCSGAGHIGLLAVAMAPRPLVCVDLNPAACDFTRSNADRAGLDVEVRQSDLAEALAKDEVFALVIADPLGARSRHRQVPRGPAARHRRWSRRARGRAVVPRGRRPAHRPWWPVLLQLGTRDQARLLADHAFDHRLQLVEIRGGERGVVARFEGCPPVSAGT